MTRFTRTVSAGAVLAMIGIAPVAFADEGPSHPEHACTCPGHQARMHDRDRAGASARLEPSTAPAALKTATAGDRDRAFVEQVWTAP